MSSSFSFGFINLIQVNGPFGGFGPGVNINLTHKKLSGAALTERQFLAAQKHRRSPPVAPKLTAKEAAQLKLDKAESRVKLLQTSSFYGSDDLAKVVADRVRADLKQARKDRDHEYYMDVVKQAWADFNNKKK